MIAVEISLDSNRFNQKLVLGNRVVFGSVNSAIEDFRAGLRHLIEICARWPGLPDMLVTRRSGLHDVADAMAARPGDIKVVVEASADPRGGDQARVTGVAGPR